jgi:hypothetical protein
LIPLLRFHFSLVLYTFHLVTSAAVHWTLNCGNRIGVYFFKSFFKLVNTSRKFLEQSWKDPNLFLCVCSKSLSLLQRHLFAYFWYRSANDH